ncbi:MAG: insulinase family protein [Vibrio sp.]
MHVSPNDNNLYQHLTLANGLRVLLVQSEQTQKSAASLAVNVGHFDDPIEREGLAHYLEHMLFLGTEKYPQSGEFQRYISQHGGSNNAWTGTEHTCFFFDVYPNAFESALSRFSQFFIAPLFNADSLEKERQAVDSEYKMKLNDDARRLYQVQKETINPEHPFAKFSVGNQATLADREQSTIRDEIITFHQTHYSADLMTLTLISPDPIDTLAQWVETYFAEIINQQLAPKTIQPPFVTPEHTAQMIYVEPIKDIRKLILSFPILGDKPHYHIKPLSYFAHLLGYEGQGSLMQCLRDQHWITSLSAGGGNRGSNYREFAVSCSLTEEGLDHIDDIIEMVFHAIQTIAQHGINSWRYAEKQAVLEAAFRFQEMSRPIDMASHLSMNLQRYQTEDTIYGDYMMREYDEALLREQLAHFTPENLRATLVAKHLDYNQQAKWYFTPYSLAPLSSQQLARWASPSASIGFELPEKNPFISYDLQTKPILHQQEEPEIIEESPGFRLWHMQDQTFPVPKGVLYIAIDSPHAVASERNIVMTRLCVEMFLDSLAEETYQAEIAGMGYNLYAHQGGVTLSISGFSEKQPQLLTMIINKFAQRHFSDARFATIKTQLSRSWSNASQDRPIAQLFNAMTGLLQPNNPPYQHLLDELETIEITELSDFVDKVLAQLHVEMFVYGDWQRDEASQLGEELKNALRVKDQEYEESLRPLVMLGDNESFHYDVACDQDDSAILVYYQSEKMDARHIALYSLANHLMSAAFFNEIRTKQQLGYMVGTGNMPLNRHPGIVLYVQSPNAAPIDLMDAVDEFLNALYMVLLELNDYQWHSSKRGLWNQIATPDQTLRSRAQRFWVAIGNKDWSFHQREAVLQELKQLSRSDMIRFVVNELKPRTSNRLVMHTKGNVHEDAPPLDDGHEIGSIESFQLRPKAYDIG